MKFAVFGDIHANLEGLGAVLADAADQGATQFACTGDVVNFNTSPAECLHRLRSLGCPVVRGDHDTDASADTDISGLNPRAKAALEWTRRALSEEDKAWLRALPLIRQVEDFTIVHSTLDAPESWLFVINKFDALGSFCHQSTQICFFGHTHTPKVFRQSQRNQKPKPSHRGAGSLFPGFFDKHFQKKEYVQIVNPEFNVIEPGYKYFINVGSVGQPWDGDWRSSYALYDQDRQTVSIRRVPFDIETTRRKNLEAGLGGI